MTDAEKLSLAIGLLRRGAIIPMNLANDLSRSTLTATADALLPRAVEALDSLYELFDEIAPDTQWMRDYYLVNGEHAILGEYGWEPGENLASYRSETPDWQPLDEVNAPAQTEVRP